MIKEAILGMLIYTYLTASQICAIYFWYLWAHEPSHGFLSSLFIGPIVGELKGLVWPFFI